jgi:alpha/beta hydrolase fold
MVMGDRYSQIDIPLDWLAGFGAVIVSVDYRLAPDFSGMTLVEDCYAGLAWTAEHASDLGIDPAKLVIAGTSAGAASPPPLRSRPPSDLGFLTHPQCVGTRRNAELTAVLAAELRSAAVADRMTYRCDVMRTAEEPQSCFLEANSLLVLNRAHLGHGAELLVERRDAHAAQLRQFLNLDRLEGVGTQVPDGAADVRQAAVPEADLAYGWPGGAGQHAPQDLAFKEGRENGGVRRPFDQREQSRYRVQHLRRRGVDRDARGRGSPDPGKARGCLYEQFGDRRGAKFECEPEVGLGTGGLSVVAGDRPRSSLWA